jgi:hypothetical protein
MIYPTRQFTLYLAPAVDRRLEVLLAQRGLRPGGRRGDGRRRGVERLMRALLRRRGAGLPPCRQKSLAPLPPLLLPVERGVGLALLGGAAIDGGRGRATLLLLRRPGWY